MLKKNACAVAALAILIAAPAIAAETTGQYVSDATITTKVKAALLADSKLKEATKVSVETTQGTVQLTGTVLSKAQESEAVNTANQVDGVKSVKDQLTVSASSSD